MIARGYEYWLKITNKEESIKGPINGLKAARKAGAASTRDDLRAGLLTANGSVQSGAARA
jgi:hypothetical protein